MKSTDLYNRLEQDFVTHGISEGTWYDWLSGAHAHISEEFKRRCIGLMCDFAQEISAVYTAVFPSDAVLEKILADGTRGAMLFLHHPATWDLSKDPDTAFYEINPGLLARLKERHVSLFNFHAPLDNFGEYSTSKTLADALGVKIKKPFAEYHGGMCGVIGTTECKNIHALLEKYAQTVGHETKLYQYGDSEIPAGRVAIVAGGGCDEDVLTGAIEVGANVLITGVSLMNKYTAAAHELAKSQKINIIGGTHYSSEKFACIAMCRYFEKLGLAAEFIPDAPCMEDL